MILPIAEQRESNDYPIVTVSLILLNMIVFGVELVVGDDAILPYCFVPAHPTLVTMFTAMFLHGGIWHIVGNMLFLWIVGPNIEEAFTPLGMLALYLGAGVFADLAQRAIEPSGMMTRPVLGASGAIAGLMGASIVIFPRTKVVFWYWISWFWVGTFELDAFWAIGFWFLEQLFLQRIDSNGMVAYGAHIGGFTVSAIIALLLVFAHVVQPHWQRPRHWPQRRPEPPPRERPARPETQSHRLIRTAQFLGLSMVVIAGLAVASVKGFMLVRQSRMEEAAQYYLVVVPPTANAVAVQTALQQVHSVSVQASPHTSYHRTMRRGWWLACQGDPDAVAAQRDVLTTLKYPALVFPVGDDLSVVRLQKVFANRAQTRHTLLVLDKRSHGVLRLAPMQAFQATAIADEALIVKLTDPNQVSALHDVVTQNRLLMTPTSSR